MTDHPRSRSLKLHVSALNDAEYGLFTASFRDLIDNPHEHLDDSHYDLLTTTIREARAWLRGRYNDIPSQDIDTILRIISPNHSLNDSITGAQFFAVMRLVIHFRAGSPPDPALVFIQAAIQPHPPPKLPTPHTHERPHLNGLPLVHPTLSAPVIPLQKPIAHSRIQNPSMPNPFPPPSVPPKPNNPFVNRSRSQDPTPLQNSPLVPVRQRTMLIDSKQPPLPPRKPSAPPPPPPRHVPGFPPQPSVFPTSGKTSVLIQQSLQATRIAQSLKKADEKLQQERAFEVLKASSVNGKRTRSISPTKDINKAATPSSSSSGASSTGFGSSTLPTLPPRRKAPTPPSPIESYGSIEQIATASVGAVRPPSVSSSSSFVREQAQQLDRISRSPFRSPSKPPIELDPESPSRPSQQPPPTHPDRKFTKSLDGDNSSPSSPTSRLFRSKSMHQASPPPIPPLTHRRRPESVQLTPTSPGFPPIPAPSYPSTSAQKQHSLSRHLSLSSPLRNKDRDVTSLSDSPMAGLQKTFTQLQQKAQPKIDAARYKAEAGLSRRGFVNHSQHGGKWLREDVEAPLMDDTDTPSPFTPNRSMEDLEDETGSELDRSWDERLKKVRANFEKSEKDDLFSSKASPPWVEDRDPTGDGWKLLP